MAWMKLQRGHKTRSILGYILLWSGDQILNIVAALRWCV